MKFKIALIFWMIIIKASANAHLTALEPADTSTFIFFPKTYGEKKWKVLVGLDARRSFFQGQKVKIDGLRIGAQFRGVHRFGLGTYSLSQKIIFSTY